MHFRKIFYSIGFLQCFFLVVRCDDCTNVTIANADDAAQVRKNCKTIKGWLEFPEDLDETINLDGVETIEGDVVHDGGWNELDADEGDSYPTGTTPFTIHSSTLKTIEGRVDFWRFNGLEELRFPNLTKVCDGFSMGAMNYLKLVDITKLTHLGSLNLGAKFLTTMRHEGFEGFTNTSYNGGSLRFSMAALDSLDSWFRYPLVIRRRFQEFPLESAPTSVDINGYYFPRLKNITIGWKETDKIWIQGDDIRVRFGGNETESMEVDLIMLSGNFTTLERGPVLKNLTAGALIFEKSSDTNLDLSALDKLTNLTIRDNDNLEKIRLPPAAVDWEDVNLDLYYNRKLNLTSEYRDAENRTNRFWYWPQGDMSSVSIDETPIGNDFFTSFLQERNASSNAAKVLDSFHLSLPWHNESDGQDVMAFNCTPFDQLRNRSVLPKDYSCESSEDASGSPALLVGVSVILALFVSVINLL